MKLLLVFTICLYFSCNEEVKQKMPSSSDTTQIEAESGLSKSGSDTVNAPRLVEANFDGTIILNAENGNPVGPEIKYMPEWRAFGWFTGADRVEWDILVDHQGKYGVDLEWSVSDEEAGKEFIIEAKDSQLTGVVKPSGSWETYKSENIGEINLPKGRQKVIFKSKTKFDKGALLDLRQIMLVPAK